MKLHFEPDLDYQHAAIDAVCGIFRGQEINRTEFTVAPVAFGGETASLGWLDLEQAAPGVGNRLTLGDDEILDNLRAMSRSETGCRPPKTWSPATSRSKWKPERARPTSISGQCLS